MTDKYTAEQYERAASAARQIGQPTWAEMFDQAAQMMREREVGGVVTDAERDEMRKLWERWANSGHTLDRAWTEVLTTFASRRAAVPDALVELHAACKERDEAQAAWNSLAGARRKEPGPEYQRSRKADARYEAAMLAAAPEVTK